MNMTEMFQLLDAFQSIYSTQFRYVAGKWWTLQEGYWSTVNAKPRMAKALLAMACDVWPEGHSCRRQVVKDYMITRLCAGLVPAFSATTLPGRAEHMSQ